MLPAGNQPLSIGHNGTVRGFILRILDAQIQRSRELFEERHRLMREERWPDVLQVCGESGIDESLIARVRRGRSRVRQLEVHLRQEQVVVHGLERIRVGLVSRQLKDAGRTQVGQNIGRAWPTLTRHDEKEIPAHALPPREYSIRQYAP